MALLSISRLNLLGGCSQGWREKYKDLDTATTALQPDDSLNFPTSMASQIAIYTGFWIDRSFDSSIAGATLTLPIREANYLVTFLALLVTICASFFWIIFALVLHQLLVCDGSVDIATLQVQVALRNSGTPISFVWQSMKILLAWRNRKVTGLWRRTIVLAVPVLTMWIAFVAASIFVAEVASKDYRNVPVLAKEGLCGIQEHNSTRAALGESNRKMIMDTIAGRQYAKAWYGSNVSSLTAQTLFPVTKLPYKTDNSTPCPWDDRCVLGPSGAFSLQTELLDTHDLFGINARREDRITYRKNVTCSVVRTLDFQQRMNDTDDTSGVPKWINYHMGSVLGGTSNVTYSYFMELVRGSAGYVIFSLFRRPGENATTWMPVAPFNRNDSDFSMFWLSQNAVEYDVPTNDPLYFANGTFTGTWGVQPNHWVNVMACADRHQFCNPLNNVCSTWGGTTSMLNQILSLNYSTNQLATAATRFFVPLVSTDTWSSVGKLGTAALLAQEAVDGTLSVGLPDNQWQLEVTRWFETSLAKLQSSIIQYAQNDVNPNGPIKIRGPSYYPDDPKGFVASMEYQCRNQRIQSSGQVQSFSALGLFMVVCITFVVGIIAIILEKIVGLVRNDKISTRDTALQADDSQHLLRMLLQNEAQDHDVDNHWQNSAYGVPVCDGDAKVSRPSMGLNHLSNYRSDPNYPAITEEFVDGSHGAK